MKNRQILRFLVLAGMLVLGGVIISYYWSVNTLGEIKYVPLYLMIICVGYILLQIGRRVLFRTQDWWDWLYYFGLLAIVIPIFFASEKNESLYHAITDYGTFFLIIPVLLDGIQLLKRKS